MSQTFDADFIVIGAGMAGASAAAPLAERGRVVVLEREGAVGYHSTGRSAAVFSQMYGNEVIRALTRASRQHLFEPPPGFAAAPLVHKRAVLYFGLAHQRESLREFRAAGDIQRGTVAVSAEAAAALLPVFDASQLAGGVLDASAADLDVDALHQGFLRCARALGASVRLECSIQSIDPIGGGWSVATSQGLFTAPVVINAAGAWGDEVARLAGVEPVGLQPMRRTALLIDAPDVAGVADMPTAIAVDESFYFKPDAGLLLLSPADETPCEPCDVQPEEFDVAIAIDRFETATGRRVGRIRSRWAGLRVFSPDRTPVVGFEPSAPGFFWLVGQGGYGIQTAPALGRLAAVLASRSPVPDDVIAAGVDVAALLPQRLRP